MLKLTKAYQACVHTLFFCATLFTCTAQDIDYGSLKSKADSIFAKWNAPDQPGVVAAVVKNGKVVYQNSFGSANLEYQIPMEENTRFHVASLSKQFTAYAILLLQQQGKLSLGDDVRKYLPEVPDFGKTITLKHLATHTSGLRDQWRLLQLAGWRWDDVFTTKQVMKFVENQEDLNFVPGEKVMYSNTGFTLLAEVVARVSGQTFAEFTKQYIFQVLQMEDSFFYDDHQQLMSNRAYSYEPDDAGGYRKKTLSFSIVGPTSLFSTAGDLSKWIIYLNDPKPQHQKLVDQMNTLFVLNNGKTSEAGLGQFGGVTYAGMEWWDHSGSDAGYRAYLARFPASKSGVVVLSNVSNIGASSRAYELINSYLNEFFKPSTAAKQVFFEPDPKTFLPLSKADLNQYLGIYWDINDQYKREIKMNNDTLVYYRSQNSESKLMPIGKNKFRMLGDTKEVTIVFEATKNGEKRMQMIINGQPSYAFTKFAEKVDLSTFVGEYYSPELKTTYNFRMKDQQLVVQHYRLEDIYLNPINDSYLTADDRNFKQLHFQRNKRGKITGFDLSNGGVKGLSFIKK